MMIIMIMIMIQDLAQHMEKVATSPALYNSYFWWRQFYEVHNGHGGEAGGWVVRVHVLVHLPWVLILIFTAVL